MINNLIFPHLCEQLKEKIKNINNFFEKINTNIQHTDNKFIYESNQSNQYNIYLLTLPSNIFQVLNLLSKENISNSIYSDLLVYESINNSPINIRYINKNISYFGQNTLSFTNKKTISSYITKNDNSISLIFTDNNLSINKTLFFKSNREQIKQIYNDISTYITKSELYYNTYNEIFNNNNTSFVENWINLNSKEILCFSLYSMNDFMKGYTINQYYKTKGNLTFKDFQESILSVKDISQKHILNAAEKNQMSLDNILSYLSQREHANDKINQMINKIFETIHLHYFLENKLSISNTKTKKNKI